MPLHHLLGKPEVEGTVVPGILAASWSPDDSLLVLVTGTQSARTHFLFLVLTRI